MSELSSQSAAPTARLDQVVDPSSATSPVSSGSADHINGLAGTPSLDDRNSQEKDFMGYLKGVIVKARKVAIGTANNTATTAYSTKSIATDVPSPEKDSDSSSTFRPHDQSYFVRRARTFAESSLDSKSKPLAETPERTCVDSEDVPKISHYKYAHEIQERDYDQQISASEPSHTKQLLTPDTPFTSPAKSESFLDENQNVLATSSLYNPDTPNRNSDDDSQDNSPRTVKIARGRKPALDYDANFLHSDLPMEDSAISERTSSAFRKSCSADLPDSVENTMPSGDHDKSSIQNGSSNHAPMASWDPSRESEIALNSMENGNNLSTEHYEDRQFVSTQEMPSEVCVDPESKNYEDENNRKSQDSSRNAEGTSSTDNGRPLTRNDEVAGDQGAIGSAPLISDQQDGESAAAKGTTEPENTHQSFSADAAPSSRDPVGDHLEYHKIQEGVVHQTFGSEGTMRPVLDQPLKPSGDQQADKHARFEEEPDVVVHPGVKSAESARARHRFYDDFNCAPTPSDSNPSDPSDTEVVRRQRESLELEYDWPENKIVPEHVTCVKKLSTYSVTSEPMSYLEDHEDNPGPSPDIAPMVSGDLPPVVLCGMEGEKPAVSLLPAPSRMTRGSKAVDISAKTKSARAPQGDFSKRDEESSDRNRSRQMGESYLNSGFFKHYPAGMDDLNSPANERSFSVAEATKESSDNSSHSLDLNEAMQGQPQTSLITAARESNTDEMYPDARLPAARVQQDGSLTTLPETDSKMTNDSGPEAERLKLEALSREQAKVSKTASQGKILYSENQLEEARDAWVSQLRALDYILENLKKAPEYRFSDENDVQDEGEKDSRVKLYQSMWVSTCLSLSLVNLKLQEPGAGIMYAQRVLEVQPNNSKALYRKATGESDSGLLDAAQETLSRIPATDQQDPLVVSLKREIGQALVRRRQLEAKMVKKLLMEKEILHPYRSFGEILESIRLPFSSKLLLEKCKACGEWSMEKATMIKNGAANWGGRVSQSVTTWWRDSAKSGWNWRSIVPMGCNSSFFMKFWEQLQQTRLFASKQRSSYFRGAVDWLSAKFRR